MSPEGGIPGTVYNAGRIPQPMSHSFCTNLIHLVWSTRYRKNTIPEDLLLELWDYFIGIGYNKKIPVIAAGGISNHVHVAIQLPPTKALAQALSILKSNSSRWLKEQGIKNFEWQTGYGAFSFAIRQTEQVKHYIHHQAEHHKRYSFEEEFLGMLKRAGVDYDPKHVFD